MTERIEVSNGAGWVFALKIGAVLLPIILMQSGALLYWIGKVEARVTHVERRIQQSFVDLRRHDDAPGHRDALVILNRNAEKIDALLEGVRGLDDRLKRQRDEFNRR